MIVLKFFRSMLFRIIHYKTGAVTFQLLSNVLPTVRVVPPVRVLTICTFLAGFPACDSPSPPTQPTEFIRAAATSAAADSSEERKVRFGEEYRNVLFTSYGTGLKIAQFASDGSVRLGDFIETHRLQEESLGLAIDFVSSHGSGSHFMPLNDSGVRENLADHRLQLIGASDSADEERGAYITATEVLPLPRELAVGPVDVPHGAILSTGIGFGVSIQNTSVIENWTNESESTLAKRSKFPVKFIIEAVSDDGNSEIFAQTMIQPDPSEVAPAPWVEVYVSLERFAGERIDFKFRTEDARQTPEGEPNLASPVWSDPIIHVPSAPNSNPDRPNVIIISLDTLRADHLGAYGYHRPTSPQFDRIASQSILFENCYAPSSWTLPSHASLFTGEHPAIHRAGSASGYYLDDTFITIAELARQHGYLTAAFTEGVAVSGELGLYQGFDLYFNGFEKNAAGTVQKTFDAAEGWLNRYGHLPFFLFLHTYQVHAPYKPPASFLGKFGDHAAYIADYQPDPGKIDVDAYFNKRRDLYDTEIAYMDSVLGQFYGFLEDTRLLDNTVLLVVSDHGERFGEHFDPRSSRPFAGHGVTLYNDVLRVPFVLKIPGHDAANSRISHPIALSDGFMTLLDLIGITPAHTPSDSYSVLPLIANRGGYRRDVVTASLLRNPKPPTLLMSILDREWKYITESPVRAFQPQNPLHRYVNGDSPLGREMALLSAAADDAVFPDEVLREQVFNIRDDPDELDDLSRENDERSAAMATLYLKALEKMSRGSSNLLDQYSSGGKSLSVEQEETLRAVGYVD